MIIEEASSSSCQFCSHNEPQAAHSQQQQQFDEKWSLEEHAPDRQPNPATGQDHHQMAPGIADEIRPVALLYYTDVCNCNKQNQSNVYTLFPEGLLPDLPDASSPPLKDLVCVEFSPQRCQCTNLQKLRYSVSVDNSTYPSKVMEHVPKQIKCSNNSPTMKDRQQRQPCRVEHQQQQQCGQHNQPTRQVYQQQEQTCGQHNQPTRQVCQQQEQQCACKRPSVTRKISNVEGEELKRRSSLRQQNRGLQNKSEQEFGSGCIQYMSHVARNEALLSASRISIDQTSVDLFSKQVQNENIATLSSRSEHSDSTCEPPIRRLSLVKNIWANEEVENAESLSKIASEGKSNQKRHRLTRGLCILGWILCCPCWTIGFTLREQPIGPDEGFDDPCWPC